jgi:hypothetical protein
VSVTPVTDNRVQGRNGQKPSARRMLRMVSHGTRGGAGNSILMNDPLKG